MTTVSLDDVDRQILSRLQRNARDATAAGMAEAIGVAPNTVRNRIQRLEEEGVILDYIPFIDYELLGYPLVVLALCTAPVSERDAIADELLELPGIVNVRVLMVGTDNIHVKVVGRDRDDITATVSRLEDHGVTVSSEILIRRDEFEPLEIADRDPE